MAPRSAARSRGGKTPGTSKKQYRQVKGVRYDDGALAIADDADKISLPVAKAIFEEVQDGGVVTPTEWRTLSYIADGGKDGAQYALTAPARKSARFVLRTRTIVGRPGRPEHPGKRPRQTSEAAVERSLKHNRLRSRLLGILGTFVLAAADVVVQRSACVAGHDESMHGDRAGLLVDLHDAHLFQLLHAVADLRIHFKKLVQSFKNFDSRI